MRFQVYLSVFASTIYMADASDSLGHSNCSALASAPIDLFTMADAHAMNHAQPAPVNKIDQAGTP